MSETEIFDAARMIDASEERGEYLERVCAGNGALRSRVESLLRAHDAASSFLIIDDPGTDPEVGQTIDSYKLLQRIGEGGFGTVYMAEQQEPIVRKVAIKVIKLGMDTRHVVARFEAERQALALMEHPNIARVLDGGATDSGRPYFVMELVKGVSITEYCDANNLGTTQRLELFIDVCSAVQHAHTKGIIHRDIKPSNVMVTLRDDRPVPKVIDFGIAKATHHRLTDKTLLTEYRQLLGTPEYMSPEQAVMSGLDVDTRTDIYSLGVLLYELLTGSTPFDAQSLRRAAFDEMQRIIRESEPPKPSARLRTMGEQLQGVARHRGAEPAGLSRLVRGDLDWIVMKMLEKDRARRYATASDLARDVRRHLDDEPVIASPPSVGYRLGKFIRRNRIGVLTASLVVTAVLVGLALAMIGFMNANSERRKAELALSDRVHAALNQTAFHRGRGEWSEALAAAQMANKLAEEATDSLKQRAAQVLLETRKDQQSNDLLAALDRIRQPPQSYTYPIRPTDWSAVNAAYGTVFRRFGLDPEAGGENEAAVRIRSRGAHEDLAARLDEWASARRLAGDPGGASRIQRVARLVDLDEARGRLRQAIAAGDTDELMRFSSREDLRRHGPLTLDLLGHALLEASKLEESLRVYRAAQHLHPDDFILNVSLARALRRLELPAAVSGTPADGVPEAACYYMVAIALRPGHPAVRGELIDVFLDSGRRDLATAFAREAVRIWPQDPHLQFRLKFFLSADADPRLLDMRRMLASQPTRGERFHGYDRLERELTSKGDLRGAYLIRRLELSERPENMGAIGDVVWYLATASDAARRDPGEAVSIARAAVEEGDDGHGMVRRWRLLGVALHSAGRWKESVEAFTAAGGSEGDCTMSVMLSIAYHHLGNRQKARTCLERAETLAVEKPLEGYHKNQQGPAQARLLGEARALVR